jgi:hypothetical protein
MTVHFRDGARARLEPGLRVFEVTAPNGKTCSLKDNEAKAYLAAMCSHQETADQIAERLGAHPFELAGQPDDLPEEDLPEVDSVAIDVYV